MIRRQQRYERPQREATQGPSQPRELRRPRRTECVLRGDRVRALLGQVDLGPVNQLAAPVEGAFSDKRRDDLQSALHGDADLVTHVGGVDPHRGVTIRELVQSLQKCFALEIADPLVKVGLPSRERTPR